MIDTETLGKERRAIILSVGAVVMDMEELKIVDRHYWVLDTKDQGNRNIDVDTVMWWMQQNDDARAAFRKIIPATSAVDFIREFSSVFTKWNTQTAWANGTSFDLGILGSFIYENTPGPGEEHELVPWNYRVQDMRSLRTIFAEALPYERFYAADSGTAHNALDDAVRQANYVLEIKKWVRNQK